MGKRYSEVEIEKGLLAAATLGIRPAARELGIPHETIFAWTRDKAERYAEIREEEAPKWRARAAAFSEDLADRHRELANKVLDKAETALEAGKLEPKDYANLLKTSALNMGISVDKAEKLRDRPQQVVEHRYDIDQVAKVLARYDVESTAVEEEPPQLDAGEQG